MIEKINNLFVFVVLMILRIEQQRTHRTSGKLFIFQIFSRSISKTLVQMFATRRTMVADLGSKPSLPLIIFSGSPAVFLLFSFRQMAGKLPFFRAPPYIPAGTGSSGESTRCYGGAFGSARIAFLHLTFFEYSCHLNR